MNGMAEYFGWMVGLLHPTERRTTTEHDCCTIDENMSNESRRDCRDIMCNCITCCYFTLALILFSIGTAITVFTLNDSESYFISLGHMWVIGPIFICSGVMVAIKTIIYARRQSMVALLTRQRDFRCPTDDLSSPRDPANYMLPPSYDSIAGECSQRPSGHSLQPSEYSIASRGPIPAHPDPPPCYEEALLGGATEANQFLKGACPYARHPLPKQSNTSSEPPQRAKGPQTL